METISRAAAMAAGLKQYFTGKPCKHGHIAHRYIHNGCSTCSKIKVMQYYADNREHCNANARVSLARRAPEVNALRREKWSENKDDLNAARREKESQNRERVRQLLRESYQRNAPQRRVDALRNHERRSLRIVPWSEAEEILAFYAACPDGYEVDHEIPLQGENVSGLHVRANLQYLTVHENRSKKNRWE